MAEDDSEKMTEDVYRDNRCGIGSCKPKALQKCSTIQAFVGFYSIVSLVTQMLVSYLGSQIPSIEKQFGLSSSYSGLLMTFNDIGYLTVCLFVTTLSKYVYVPRWLFGCFIMYGLSGILCGIPHFFSVASGVLPSLSTDVSMNSSDTTAARQIPMCTGNTSVSDKCGSDSSSTSGNVNSSIRTIFLVLFGTGMFLQGASKSIRGPFVTVYLDDEGDKKKTGYYAGLIIGVTVIGPVLSYVFGGIFSKLYVTLEDVDFGPRDPRWIGAWWLGFIAFGACAMVFSIPLLFFPRHLKPPTDDLPKKTSAIAKDRIMSFWRVLKNPVYLLLLCADTVSAASFVALFAFLSKYIATQFTIPLWHANVILAVANIGSIALGSFVGGFITKRMKLTPRRTFGLIILFYAIHVLLTALGLLLGCNKPTFVGPESNGVGKLEETMCSVGCGCDENEYFPVCGSDNINYHSPCYAGCENLLHSGKTYTNCTCIPDGIATSGLCKPDCVTLWPYAVTCALSGFMVALTISPGVIARIRCVQDRDKSTAVGLSQFTTSLLAYMPTPILLGKVIDTTCLIWQKTCGTRGACLLHDIVDFRIKLHLIVTGCKLLAFVFYSIAFFKVKKMASWFPDKENTEYKIDNIASAKEGKLLINGEKPQNE